MSPLKTGRLIALKRKEHKLTQEQLAERINVSGKTVSKWECGKCMPDSAVMEDLCSVIDVSLNELLMGEVNMEEQRQTETEKCVMQAVQTIERLEKEKRILVGLLLIILGITLLTLSQTITGQQPMYQFLSGLALGLSCGIMIIGVYVSIKCFSQTYS